MKRILITLTSPTCSGKSYLLSYIRDVAKLPCFVSTTTRPPREGEVEGKDYYFISHEKSVSLEKDNQFAELAIFRGFRYGVTKKEFAEKLDQGPAFLIVEPSGIDHYVQPALEMGAEWLKYFVYTKPEIQVERFKKRFQADVLKALQRSHDLEKVRKPGAIELWSEDPVLTTTQNYTDRLIHLLGPESKWFEAKQWDGILYGDKDPATNLKIIMADIQYKLHGTETGVPAPLSTRHTEDWAL